MEEELGGAACEYCGDPGGASALILCENSHLGCLGGRHLYCFLPVKRELGAEEFYCDMCRTHRVREAAAKTRAEEAAAAAAAAEAAQPPPPKRQRLESRASQGAAPPQRAGPAPRPVAAASRGTLSFALEGIEDDVVRRNSMIDGTYHYQHAPRELPSLSWQYTLPNLAAGGELWSGNLGIPITIAPSSQVRAVCYPVPGNPCSVQAAACLPPNLQGAHEFTTLEKQGLRDIEDIYRNASIVLAYGGAEEGRAQAGDQEAASWCRLWDSMQSGRLALKLELEQGMQLLLYINERAPPAVPGQPSGTFMGLFAVPLPPGGAPSHRLLDERGEPKMLRGILKKAPGQRKSLVWSERPVEAGKLSFCELGPGPHYSAPQTVEKPVPPPEERPVARPGALTSSHELPLQGVRISLMGFQITPEVTQLLTELRHLGAASFPRPIPGCEDVVCIHHRKASDGLQLIADLDMAACLVAQPYLLVYEDLHALYHMLKTKAPLRLGDCEPFQLFPRGLIAVVDGAAACTMRTQLLAEMLEGAAARLARDPAARTLFMIPPQDMQAWEGCIATGDQTATENLALWRAAGQLTKTMTPKDMSTAALSEVSPIIRHAVKIMHNSRKSRRHLFLIGGSRAIIEEASHQNTIHSGGAEDFLEFVSSAAGV